ncbi:chromosome partitioning protein ParA [Haemophilus influenzae biotype aegyptius]|uniref:helix-turn-helix domain-containing protein n=1 Tax=Haemophilus influenzae TaxID=727 RepID=UPI0001F36DDA|nr:helix-turn-helix domain-containing protein [Haemophilus influenzae]QEQ61703.1 bacteriophage CI repressor [Haemophilus influenzae biotype aegyptius]QEQ64489.1 bacteriophage CI repressor [Haemophilus influenzae biotype aegyptius]QEQ65475.1 bacteriophage CI repressor [Haemophilus influenzae biotype aegyptius]TMQ37256.1 chromosome partitioning protein ParA [Haemophilus influenzae biotype aegyptius]TMQ38305.1 chromosome partitioning protein ParA [Haemophilus influenzae biotype aegyptius]
MENRIDLNSYEIIERMKKICNVHTDKELATVIGIQPPSVNKWKVRNLVPLGPLLIISNQFSVSLDWLIFGCASNDLSTHEKLALIAFNDLDDHKKLEAIAFMTGLKTSSSQTGAITQHVSGSKK